MKDENINFRSIAERRDRGMVYIPEDRLSDAIILPYSLSRNYLLGNHRKKDFRAGFKYDKAGIKAEVERKIEEYDIAEKQGLLPIGLSEGAVLKKDIKKSRPINYNDVDLASDSLVHTLRKIQDGQNI